MIIQLNFIGWTGLTLKRSVYFWNEHHNNLINTSPSFTYKVGPHFCNDQLDTGARNGKVDTFDMFWFSPLVDDLDLTTNKFPNVSTLW